MIDCREVYLSNQHQEEWYFIHKNDFACEEDLLVQLNQSYIDHHLIPSHYIQIFPSGIAFKYCNILAPYLLFDFNILDCH